MISEGQKSQLDFVVLSRGDYYTHTHITASPPLTEAGNRVERILKNNLSQKHTQTRKFGCRVASRGSGVVQGSP